MGSKMSPPRRDFLREFHSRSMMDHIPRNILGRLDLPSLQNCLAVSTVWRKLALDAAARLPGPQEAYMAAKAGHKAIPFLAHCNPEWRHELTEPPNQKWQLQVRDFKGGLAGWYLSVEGYEEWEPRRPKLKSFKKGFKIPSAIASGRNLLFVLSGNQRGLWDLDTKEWVWLRNHEQPFFFPHDGPFAGPGFVGMWGNNHLAVYSLHDGAVLKDKRDFNVVRMVLVSKGTLLVLELRGHLDLMEQENTQPYCLFQVNPDGVISETIGHIAPPGDNLRSGRLFLDSERFLVAANGSYLKRWMKTEQPRTEQPMKTDRLVVWDLLRPVQSQPGLPAIASSVPLTDTFCNKFAVYFRDVVDGMWILNIRRRQGNRKAPLRPESPLDSRDDYVLCFDARRMELLEKLTLRSEPGTIKFKEMVPQGVT